MMQMVKAREQYIHLPAELKGVHLSKAGAGVIGLFVSGCERRRGDGTLVMARMNQKI